MTANKLRALSLPAHNNKEIDRYACDANVVGLSDEQIDKINHLFKFVYGHGQHENKGHHYFLQGIVHYSKMDFNIWEDQLCDECILDVFEIAPELFDAEKIRDWYAENGVLDV